MIRITITLPREIKNWLDNYSRIHRRPTAETIREAIIAFKSKTEIESYEDLLSKTLGIWKDHNVDASDYV